MMIPDGPIITDMPFGSVIVVNPEIEVTVVDAEGGVVTVVDTEGGVVVVELGGSPQASELVDELDSPVSLGLLIKGPHANWPGIFGALMGHRNESEQTYFAGS